MKFKVKLRQSFFEEYVSFDISASSEYVADLFAEGLAESMPAKEYDDGDGYGTKTACWWAEVEEQGE